MKTSKVPAEHVYLPYDKISNNEEDYFDRLVELDNLLAERDSPCMTGVGYYIVCVFAFMSTITPSPTVTRILPPRLYCISVF